MKVAIFGANGQLGRSLVARFSSEHAVMACTRQDADLNDAPRVREIVRNHRPNAIINCAAYNHVDAAEEDQQTALEVNAFAVRTLARAAADVDAVLVHYGTDFVFSGTASEPYTETQTPEPQSVYAQSKLVGEWMAAIAPRHYVLRVESLFGGPAAKSSVDIIIAAVRDGRKARVFSDRWVSPSFVDDVAEATAFVLGPESAVPGPRSGPQSVPFGLYHCVNTGVATWEEIGQEIVRLLDRNPGLLEPISVNDVTLRATRPRYAALSNRKLTRAGFAMPSWQDALARYLGRVDG